MDQITFHHNSVLSDVHLLLPNARHLMTRLNQVGQPVFISKFKILSDGERRDSNDPQKSKRKDGDEGVGGNMEPVVDEDGDIRITRRLQKNAIRDIGRDLVCPIILKQSNPVLEQQEEKLDEVECFKDIVMIEHTMATPLEDVGKQIWRGAFLLADFILSKPFMFKGATVLELGAGTGLTSIIMATIAKTVYCTDVGEDLLSMCKRNITLNSHLMELSGGEVKVRKLDWLQHDLCADADMEFSWTAEEVVEMYTNTSFIIASDVCYDDDLTDGFFRTLYRLCNQFHHNCTILISIEKRMNFTLRHLNVSCKAYDYFSHCLAQLQNLVDGKCSFRVEQLPPNFPQFLSYERTEQLELWKVSYDHGQSEV